MERSRARGGVWWSLELCKVIIGQCWSVTRGAAYAPVSGCIWPTCALCACLSLLPLRTLAFGLLPPAPPPGVPSAHAYLCCLLRLSCRRVCGACSRCEVSVLMMRLELEGFTLEM
jgi:hypothetical protein